MDQRGLKALQQRVVQLARDARPLFDTPFQPGTECSVQLDHADFVRCPHEGKKSKRAQSEKPPHLVKMGAQREMNVGALFVPDPETVRRHHPERVLARRHVRIMRGSPRAGVYPVFVVGFEPVLEALFLRSGKAQSGEREIGMLCAPESFASAQIDG
jgi:hypothetical protein